jgi:HEAT repeat protein
MRISKLIAVWAIPVVFLFMMGCSSEDKVTRIYQLEESRSVGELEGYLTDSDPNVCDNAAEALGRIRDPGAVEPITRLLSSQNPQVRQTAANALGAIGAVSGIDALAGCLHDSDPQVRQSAAQALGQMTDPRAIRPLVAYLHDLDSQVRRSAAEGLQKLKYEPPNVNSRIAFFLAEWEFDEVAAITKPDMSPLVKSLSDQDSEFRMYAAQTLEKNGWLPPDADSKVVYLIAEQKWDDLSQLGALSVTQLDSYLADHDLAIRCKAAETLGKIRDPRSVEPLITLLRGDDALVGLVQGPGVRACAAEALGKIGDARAVAPLAIALHDEDQGVRLSAALALAQFRDSRALPYLESDLPDWEIHSELIEALGRVGWTPSSTRERVYFWIGREDSNDLNANWPMVMSVLQEDCETATQAKVCNALYTCVCLGKKDLNPVFLELLNTRGNSNLATLYLNCDFGDLSDAAQAWVTAHGGRVFAMPSGNDEHLHSGAWVH